MEGHQQGLSAIDGGSWGACHTGCFGALVYLGGRSSEQIEMVVEVPIPLFNSVDLIDPLEFLGRQTDQVKSMTDAYRRECFLKSVLRSAVLIKRMGIERE